MQEGKVNGKEVLLRQNEHFVSLVGLVVVDVMSIDIYAIL